ncbi:hypothetical protein [Cellvibrio sp.]
MTSTALIFYPEPYVGFNKTQLLERHLSAAGVVGSKFKSSSFFSAGQNFRQFIPKVDSIHRYHYGLIRIQIQAVGVWAKAEGRAAILDCSNAVLVEGDIIGYPLERYSAFRELLTHITGDQYEVGVVHDPLGGGVSEPESNYHITGVPELVD